MEWKERAKNERREHEREVNDLHKTLLQMLEERDQFAELNGYKLTLSRFRFPSDSERQKTKMRIRVTNLETSESAVVMDISEQGDICLLTGMALPDEVADRVRAEWRSIRETGKVSKESSDYFHVSRGL